MGNVRESSRVNGRQKTSISISSSNNHQIKPMLSKARSRENIAASHGNLSISTNSLKDSAPSARLYEFGYDYDNDTNHSNKKKLIQSSQMDGHKSGRGDTNSLSRRHLDRKASKQNAPKIHNSQDIPQDIGKIPSPPIILPVLPQDDSIYENKTKVKLDRDVPNVREMAWTSLVDTATKATTKGSGDKHSNANARNVDGDTKHKKTISNIGINKQQTKAAVLQLSPENMETEVTYFTS